jgi:hypothetical protein
MSGKSMLVLGLAGLSGLGAMYGTSRMLAGNKGGARSRCGTSSWRPAT